MYRPRSRSASGCGNHVSYVDCCPRSAVIASSCSRSPSRLPVPATLVPPCRVNSRPERVCNGGGYIRAIPDGGWCVELGCSERKHFTSGRSALLRSRSNRWLARRRTPRTQALGRGGRAREVKVRVGAKRSGFQQWMMHNPDPTCLPGDAVSERTITRRPKHLPRISGAAGAVQIPSLEPRVRVARGGAKI